MGNKEPIRMGQDVVTREPRFPGLDPFEEGLYDYHFLQD
jgi:hypothetical protein